MRHRLIIFNMNDCNKCTRAKLKQCLLLIITTLRTESNMACIVTVSIKVDALFNQVLTTVPIKWNL